MIIDALLMVSDAQALTATAVSTNTIDLGNPTIKNRIGTGEGMGFVISVDVAADFTTGDETYSVEIIESAAANLGTPTVLARRTLTAAQLAIGAVFVIAVPKGAPILRYLGLNYVLGGTTPTLTVTAFLTALDLASTPPTNYTKGYAI